MTLQKLISRRKSTTKHNNISAPGLTLYVTLSNRDSYRINIEEQEEFVRYTRLIEDANRAPVGDDEVEEIKLRRSSMSGMN